MLYLSELVFLDVYESKRVTYPDPLYLLGEIKRRPLVAGPVLGKCDKLRFRYKCTKVMFRLCPLGTSHVTLSASNAASDLIFLIVTINFVVFDPSLASSILQLFVLTNTSRPKSRLLFVSSSHSRCLQIFGMSLVRFFLYWACSGSGEKRSTCSSKLVSFYLFTNFSVNLVPCMLSVPFYLNLLLKR